MLEQQTVVGAVYDEPSLATSVGFFVRETIEAERGWHEIGSTREDVDPGADYAVIWSIDDQYADQPVDDVCCSFRLDSLGCSCMDRVVA